MSIVPKRLNDFLPWASTHAAIWKVSPATIGLTAPQATAVDNAVNTANDNYSLQLAAYDKAKAATLTQQDSTSTARTAVADAIRSIRAFAEQQSNPSAVYAAAQIPSPATPTPMAPPGQPTDFKAQLNSDGSIRLSWKCPNPQGATSTIYFVRRRLANSTGAYTQVGVVGERAFVDDTIPSSSGGASYIVQAQRGTQLGAAGLAFTIQFGVDGPGLSIVRQFSEAA